MLELNVSKLVEVRGIKPAYSSLQRTGMGKGIVNRLLQGTQKTLTLDNIERLCKLLRCTPNDLFSWTPDNEAEDYPENTLQAVRKNELPKLDDVLGKMNLEEVVRRLNQKEEPLQPNN